MLSALHTAITSLLQTALPALFVGANAVKVSFGVDNWNFDPLSVDSVAGEAGPLDAVDLLAFNPNAPAGPYALTRPPYQGPKRVYLRSADGDLSPLSAAELTWNAAGTSFTFQPRPGRQLTGFDQVEILYGVIAAGTQLKLLHQASVTLTAADEVAAAQAMALALAVLALNRETLRRQAGFDYNSGHYQAAGTLKTLTFASGTATANTAAIMLVAEVDLLVQRLLDDDEGTPIERILSPGAAVGARRVDIDPIVES